jgi:hypothetical protein
MKPYLIRRHKTKWIWNYDARPNFFPEEFPLHPIGRFVFAGATRRFLS